MEYAEIIDKLINNRCYAKDNFVPIIRDKSSKYLFDYVRENNIKSVLEIGTAIGYSGSIILTAGAESLTTIDINAEYLKMARDTFEKLGYFDRVKIYNDDAKNVIALLLSEGKKFDMIFLDGAKGQYFRYLPTLSKLLNCGGTIFADNVLLQGLVESDGVVPHKKRTMVVNLRTYLKMVNEYPYETKLIRIEDGIAITKFVGGEKC